MLSSKAYNGMSWAGSGNRLSRKRVAIAALRMSLIQFHTFEVSVGDTVCNSTSHVESCEKAVLGEVTKSMRTRLKRCNFTTLIGVSC